MNAFSAASPGNGDDPLCAVARFREMVLQRPALHDRLGTHDAPDAFTADCQRIASDFGITLSQDDVHAAIRPDPLGINRFTAAPVAIDRWPIAGWRPARSLPGANAPLFDWAWFGDMRLTDPFYEFIMREMASRPFSLMFRTRTTLAAVVDGYSGNEDIAPDGLIFHMSRCGSTLAAQMLAAVPHHVVVSEAEPIDSVVHWATASSRPIAEQALALRAIVAAVGRGRNADGKRYFIKLDSWHARALPLFRAAFPNVPWVFLYREPLEVMASLMRLRGLQTVPGGLPPHILQIPDGDLLPSEEYCALVIERIGSAALAAGDHGGGLFVDYADLVPDMLSRVSRHFGFIPDKAEMAAMKDAAGFDAKQPSVLFRPDSASKRADVSPAVVAAVEMHLRPLHERLRKKTAIVPMCD